MGTLRIQESFLFAAFLYLGANVRWFNGPKDYFCNAGRFVIGNEDIGEM